MELDPPRRLLALAALMSCTSTWVGSALAQTTQRASVSSSGVQANAASEGPSISADGRYVAFDGSASSLVPGDGNGVADVFVRDLFMGTTERVSVSSSGAEGNGMSYSPSISSDGRFVAFASAASNLVLGDTNGVTDVFVRDRPSGTTEFSTVDSVGTQANLESEFAWISADGRLVGFASRASNLVPGDTNSTWDVFVHDRVTGVTERVSVNSSGVEANFGAQDCTGSPDGRFIGFSSFSTNLVTGDNNGAWDTFVHDRLSGTTECMSVAVNGASGNNESAGASVSADGRYVAFWSRASDLVPGGSFGSFSVYVRDRLTGTTERASVNSSGMPGIGDCQFSSITPDGRFVSFMSNGNNLVTGDTNGLYDVFVRDRVAGTTERVSAGAGGVQGNGSSFQNAISAGGRYVAFRSHATNFVLADTNAVDDIFVRDRGVGPAFTTFCAGDGNGPACPCGNYSLPGNGEGCTSSLGTGGRLTSGGFASLANDTFVLTGSLMPDAAALYFQGTMLTGPGAGAPFGDGLRCAVGTRRILAIKANSGGSSHYPEAGDPRISAVGAITVPGLRTYQVWYRNAAPFCTSATFNLTNGVQVVWGP